VEGGGGRAVEGSARAVKWKQKRESEGESESENESEGRKRRVCERGSA
jgi:hypothetical protein